MTAYIPGPAAVITGSAAFLLSKLLRAPPVAAYIHQALWLHGDDFDAMLAAVHAAGRGWESTVHLAQRDNVRAYVRSPANPGTMGTKDAAAILGLSIRRTQELTKLGSLTGHRVGRRWELDPGSVRAHRHHHQQNGRRAHT
jgi:hypothetical protein